MLEVILNDTGESLDVTGGITYVFQSAEIGQIAQINSNWSWKINFPRSPKNQKNLDGLGLINSQSNKPYESISVSVRYYSINIVDNGKLVITETTSDNYTGHVTNGVLDFFAELGDLTLEQLPEVIDPSNELNHDKNLTNIVNSWSVNGSTKKYKYIIANYNGVLNPNPNYTDFDAAYLVPSVSVDFLMNAVFNFAGWTFQGLPDIGQDWMTYGNKVQERGEVGLGVGFFELFTIYKGDFLSTGRGLINTDFLEFQTIDDDNTYINQNTTTTIEILFDGNYNIKIPQPTRFFATAFWFYEIGVYKNGVLLIKNDSRSWQEELELGAFEQGDEISFRLQAYNLNFDLSDNVRVEFAAPFEIVNKDVVATDFQSKSMQLKAKDFVKDVMMRYATSAFADLENKSIKFMDINERINADVIDWSDKYQGRTSESYVLDGYAQSNAIRHTYANDADNYHDGYLNVNNENIEAEKTLYKSPLFSSDKNKYLTENGIELLGYKSYEVEQTNTEENFNPLNDRFHYLRYIQNTEGVILINGVSYSDFDKAVSQDFDKVVPERYESISGIINRAKIVNINLFLSAFDLKDLQLDKVYYFWQEASYFLLNKLTWDSTNDISRGEFIKIERNLID